MTAKRNKKLFEKAIVQKRNVLNSIRKNNMSFPELRLFSVYLSKINARDVSTRLVRFPLEDFQKIIGISVGTDNITHFRNTIIKMLQQVVEVPNERGGYTAFQLFKQVDVDKDELGQWYVEMDAHDKALPLMFDFKDRYFSYELWNALRLKSANQIRLYELLKQYETIGKREIAVDELKNMLGLDPDEYPRLERFRVCVLDSCQQALAENTDITFTYEKGKSGQGGKWLTIIFHIRKNEKFIDPLHLSDFIAQKKNVEAMAGTDIIAQLGVICENTFPYEKMQRAYRLAKTFVSDKAIKTYFEQTYLKLLEMEDTKKIRNRFQYFFTMIGNDADKQRKEEQEREKPAGYPAAYDIAAYESTSVLDEEDE